MIHERLLSLPARRPAPLLRPVHLIGYWCSDQEPHWPAPQTFVDATWSSAERERVARHLEAGEVVNQQMGLSWCRFGCGTRAMGSRELSDGYYYWPEGLSHYVRQHAVRLPREFEEHVTGRHRLRHRARRLLYRALERWSGLTPFLSEAWWRSFPSGTQVVSGVIEDEPAGQA